MAQFGGGYVGGGRSGAADLSALTNAINARNQRMDAVQLPQLQAYGPVGLALLASQGDEAAARFMDRYYGKGKWDQYIPTVDVAESGAPTITPPEGMTWDQGQRALFETDYFGMGNATEAAPVARTQERQQRVRPVPESTRDGERPARARGGQQEPVTFGEDLPVPEEEQPPFTPPPDPGPTEVVTPPDRAPQQTTRDFGDRFIPWLQQYSTGGGTANPFAQTLGTMGVDPSGQMRMSETFQQAPATPEENLRYSTRMNAIALAQQGQDMRAVEDTMLRLAKEQGITDRGTLNSILSDAGQYWQQFLNPSAGAPPPDRSPLPMNQTREIPNASPPPQSGPPTMPPGLGTQGLSPIEQQLMQQFGGPQSMAPQQNPFAVGRDVSAEIDQMSSQMGPVRIERGVNPANGAIQEVVQVGDAAVPVRNQEQHVMAQHVEAAINAPETPRGQAGQAAMRSAVRRQAPMIREQLKETPIMLPVGDFARRVDAFVRADPAGASMYFKQMADNLIGAQGAMATAEYQRSLGRQAAATASRTEMENEAMAALPEGERNRLYRAQARLADAQATILEAQSGVATERAQAEIYAILADINMSAAQRDMLSKNLALGYAQLETQLRIAGMGAGAGGTTPWDVILSVYKAMGDVDGMEGTARSLMTDIILPELNIVDTRADQPVRRFLFGPRFGVGGATDGTNTPDPGDNEGTDWTSDFDAPTN